MITFIYCMQERREAENRGKDMAVCRKSKGRDDGRRIGGGIRAFLSRRQHQGRTRVTNGAKSPSKHQEGLPQNNSSMIELSAGGRIVCCRVSSDLRRAREQIRQMGQERIWMEEKLCEGLQLRQPALLPEEVFYLVRGMLNGDFYCSRRESILIVAPEEGQREEEQKEELGEAEYERLLQICSTDMNQYTILCKEPERYEELAAAASEQEGLLLRCVSRLPREYPLGEHLMILNFRPDYRLRPWLFGNDAVSFTVSGRGVLKFLDTTVKNSYNI